MKRLIGALLVLAVVAASTGLDGWVRDRVQARRNPTLDRVMHGASNLGKREIVFGGLLAVALLDPAGVAAARLATVALVAANVSVEGLKWIVNRPRPGGEHKRSDAAFPSGHAASAASLAWVLTRRWRRVAIPLWALAAVVAFSRVYLDRHWLSDVVFGFALGLAVAWAVSRLPGLRAPAAAAEAPR